MQHANERRRTLTSEFYDKIDYNLDVEHESLNISKQNISKELRKKFIHSKRPPLITKNKKDWRKMPTMPNIDF